MNEERRQCELLLCAHVLPVLFILPPRLVLLHFCFFFSGYIYILFSALFPSIYLCFLFYLRSFSLDENI